MIALRGKLERRATDGAIAAIEATTRVATSAPPPVALDPRATTAGSAGCTTDPMDATSWVWKGEWAFGAAVDEASPTRLPFHYAWVDAVDRQIESKPSPGDGNGGDVAAPVAVAAGFTGEDGGETKSPPESNAVEPTPSDGTNVDAALVAPKAAPPAAPKAEAAQPSAKPAPKPTLTPLPSIIALNGVALPARGHWKGSFDTLTGRKGQQRRTPVPETFVLTWNLNPDESLRTLLPDEELNTNDADGKLLPNHVHVIGRGENQYGMFELVGSFCTVTGMLTCQKRYVAATDNDSPRELASGSARPYQTRKRQMSWKRRAAYDVGDGPDEAAARRHPPPPQSKKPRAGADSATAGGDSGGGGGPAPKMSVAIPASGAVGGKRPPTMSPRPPLPHQSAHEGPKKRPAPSAGASRNIVATASNAATNNALPGGQMKLPAAGDSHKARWRAAHFLYYHRDDPAVAPSPEGNGGANSSSATHPAAPPKYLVYEGDMLNSHRHGRGVCLYNNGILYEGDWRRDKEHGQGTLMTADRKRLVYKGEWERGRMHGIGTYFYGDSKVQQQQVGGGSRYEGEFKENFRHGTGTYVLPDGSVYSGQWREGLMCGRGVFTWPDGSVYDGEWKDGKRHGLGLLRTSDGFLYDGGWVQNSMEGRGSATYPNGQQYNGLFSRGRREGRGTILFTNGAVYEGRFRDDLIDGQGTMKMSRTMSVPRSDELEHDDSATDGEHLPTGRDDYMIPVSFQSDMGHIHRKAGFTHGGK